LRITLCHSPCARISSPGCRSSMRSIRQQVENASRFHLRVLCRRRKGDETQQRYPFVIWNKQGQVTF
jgi:hypothetical protein